MQKKTVVYCALLGLWLVLSSTACIFDGSTIAIPTATIPSDVNPQSITKPDSTRMAFSQNMAQGNPGLLALALDATYDAQFPGLYETYHVDEGKSFVGQVYIFNGDNQTHDIAVICLLDHVQTPCTPTSPAVQQYIINPVTEFNPPIELSFLTVGRHDFDVLVIRDPYVDIMDTDLDSRSQTLAPATTNNLYVGNLSSLSHDPLTVFPQPKPGLTNYSSMFFVSESSELVNSNGYIPIWLSSTVTPDEMLNFYIHFNNLDEPEGQVIAVTAFINYEQVPLYYKEKTYTPLFVQRKAKTWQPTEVQIRVPNKPGVYELLVFARAHAFEPIEIGRIHPLTIFSEVSQRIRLEVKK